MKLSLRFVVPLVLVLALVAGVLFPLVDKFTLRWFVRDLSLRAQVISKTMEVTLAQLILSNSTEKIDEFFSSTITDERLFALGFCDDQNILKYKTNTFPKEIDCKILSEGIDDDYIYENDGKQLHFAAHNIEDNKYKKIGSLVIIHDMSFVDKRISETKKYVFYLFLTLAVLISLISVILAQLSWRGWISSMRSLLKGVDNSISEISKPEFLPLAKDLRALIQDLEANQRAVEEKALPWTAWTLKQILKEELVGDEILIVSNREPYIHNLKGNNIEVQVPASGLVTALEPVMRACSGTWIAHGSGSADKQVVDKNDRVHVPPDDPSYYIRRVWLTKEEESRYYYGFANEGIWPLCHIAHTRPIFRTEDWNHYVQVNKKFAEAVCEEAKTQNPVVLVQDYHLALLPRLVREKLPNATIISFWHIPWPNPEAFGICPWRAEILHGLLGSSIMGFHTKFHCNNFLDTVDRFLEARIDKETSTISYQSKLTAVKDYPISIEWPSRWINKQKSIEECRSYIRDINSIPKDTFVGIGVDRLDYTKGILERFLAVEKLFEKYPDWIGKFTFIQIAAPTRTSIDQYKNFEIEVRNLADKINSRFGNETFKPICLKIEHHEPDQVFQYYRGSDVCMVTSLHDGMNLVAKEFIASRDDNLGTLILSQFTGASRELLEALIVNPYNIDQCALALNIALAMPPAEQKARMRSMRGLVKEYNVYRWAGRMLKDAARMRERSRLMFKINESNNSFERRS